jgi:hypothetical protein
LWSNGRIPREWHCQDAGIIAVKKTEGVDSRSGKFPQVKDPFAYPGRNLRRLKEPVLHLCVASGLNGDGQISIKEWGGLQHDRQHHRLSVKQVDRAERQPENVFHGMHLTVWWRADQHKKAGVDKISVNALIESRHSMGTFAS